MNKLKGLLLLLLGALLVDFALENAVAGPQLKLFHFELGRVPVYLLVYGSLIFGFLSGWLAFALKARRQKQAASAQEKPEAPQAPQEQAYQ
ncbi:MAG: DUF1049 domain-containing protein [Deltaproteobacteria bacterium]|nr:MAG: DUF1049 domain-containing protein [Deltaproteobacteria bacterium]